jgi:hypothetical protein
MLSRRRDYRYGPLYAWRIKTVKVIKVVLLLLRFTIRYSLSLEDFNAIARAKLCGAAPPFMIGNALKNNAFGLFLIKRRHLHPPHQSRT